MKKPFLLRFLLITPTIFMIWLLYIQEYKSFYLYVKPIVKNEAVCLKGSCLRTFRYPSISAVLVNNTHENTSLVIYNRVGKSGSEMMLSLIRRLKRRNKVSLIHSTVYNQRMISEKNQLDLMRKLSHLSASTVFDRHIYFLNFNKINSKIFPAYINLVRHPVDRKIAGFFYGQNKMRWNYYQRVQKAGSNRSYENWVMQDINKAILNPNNTFFGQGNDKRGCMGSIVTYFCGQESYCLLHNSREAIQQAKLNIEQYYVWIGVLETLHDSLEVLAAYLPRFFRGILKLYKKSRRKVYNKGNYKKNITQVTLERLRKITAPDQELYDYIVQRLQKQIHQIKQL